jgi:hypothetical protein
VIIMKKMALLGLFIFGALVILFAGVFVMLNERALYDQLRAAATNLGSASEEARETVAQARIGVTAFQENMQALKQNFLFRGYFKDRGYLDSTELTKWEIQKLPDGQPLRTFVFPAGDLFEKPDNVKLKDKKRLNVVGAFLEETPFGLVLVKAFSSALGKQEENQVLTQAQAMMVRNHLADRFDFDDAKAKTKGMGEVPSTDKKEEHWIEISIYALDSGI